MMFSATFFSQMIGLYLAGPIIDKVKYKNINYSI